MTPDPSTLSVHEAPSSTKSEPNSTLILLAPERVITGAVVSGAATTFTVRVTVFPVLEAASVCVYSRVYDPIVFTSTLPEVAEGITPDPS